MSESLDSGVDQRLSTTSARLVAVNLKSANKHIFRALLSLASANLFMRLMGMVNQVVVTARFGESASMDAYFAASILPTTLAQLLASALEASVIPVYSQVRMRGNTEEASRLFSTLLNLLIVGLLVFTGAMLLFRGPLTTLFAPGLHPTTLRQTIDLTPYIFPVLIFMSLNSFMECLLNTEGQFSWPAYAGILVPLTTATFVILGGTTYGVLILCLGTIAGQILQLVVILIRARRARFRYRLVLDLHSPELMAILVVGWPALFTALISQAGPLVDQIFASYLPLGAIAAINYANKLMSVPVGVVLSSTGRAALPYLARQAAINDMQAFKGTLRLYLWAIGIGTLALTALMILLAHPAIQILFQHGAFTAEDTERTAITLIGFVIGLTPMAFGFITSRAFSALGKTRTLMYITIFSVFANAGFDYIFGRLWGSFGIALATSACYYCTMLLLLILLRRLIGPLNLLTPPHELLSALGRLGLGSFSAQWARQEIEEFFYIPHHVFKRMARAGIALLIFVAGIIGTIYNATYALRIALGSLIVLAFLRYRYALLLTWVAVNALIGSTIPFFNGNNFLSGLTVPTLLLMFVMPVKQSLKHMPALAFLLAYLIWVLLGIGISPLTVPEFMTFWIVYIAYVAVGILVINLLTTRKLLMGLIDAILLQALFLSLYGIYGYFTKTNGLYDADITSLYRIGSVFAAPPTLAFVLSMIIPLSLYRTVTLQGFRRLVGIVFTLVLLAALGLTFTRGAFISVPLSLLMMIFFLPSRKMRARLLGVIAIVAAICILVATIVDLPLLGRFLNPDIATLNGRTYLWTAILDHFDPLQVLGNGLMSSNALLERLQVGFAGNVIATAPHNIFIETLYENGIVGLILIILVLIAIPWTLISRMRRATPDHRLLLAAVLAAYINIFLQSLEVTVVWSQPVGVYVWMIMALPFALYWTKPQTPEPGSDEREGALSPEETPARIKQEQASYV
jgi:putative peptidoglycan lipid II flippase